jgi:hypothetical protein
MPQNYYNKEAATEKKKEDWMNAKWRPMMGWMYMLICLFDFMAAPILWSIMQAYFHGGVTTQWQPLTLQGAGLFHVAMGAVIGISAYGRTQEKLNGAEAGGLGSFGPGVGTTYVPPTTTNSSSQNNQSGFGGATTGAFGSGTSTPAFGSTPTPAFGSAPLGGSNASTGGFSSGFAGTNSAPAVIPTTNSFGQKVVPQSTQPLM